LCGKQDLYELAHLAREISKKLLKDKVLILVPQNVTLFADRFLTEIINLR
jgi:hypothetical protein